MARALVVLLAALSSACPVERRPSGDERQADIPVVDAGPADTLSVADELVLSGVDSLAAQACDSAATMLATVPGLVQAGSAPVTDPDTNVDLPGCHVSLSGSLTEIGSAQRPDVLLGARFIAASWRYDDRWTADGPDGTSFVLRRGESFCIVEGRWDGGADDDPSYQPPPDFVFDVRCAHRPDPREPRS